MRMKCRAVYPGTFDPITNGHLDLIERSLMIFDELIVAVAHNPDKTPLFSVKERVNMIKEATAKMKCVIVSDFDGLLINFVRDSNAQVIIRGLRAISDFEYEFQMALMNRKLNDKIETVFMMPHQAYSFLSSRMVKEIASYGGCIKGLVPECVEKELRGRFKKLK